MVKFKTQYDDHARVHCEPGSPEKVVYQAVYDINGTLQLHPTGVEDLYGYIQSHRDSVDIHVILKRFAAGEVDVLSQVQGFYADAADMPSTYQEVLNSVIAGERAFDSLPSEIKQKFGNSFSQWLTSFESPDFHEKMGWSRTAESSMSDSQKQDFTGTSPAPAPAPSSVPAPAPVISSSGGAV